MISAQKYTLCQMCTQICESRAHPNAYKEEVFELSTLAKKEAFLKKAKIPVIQTAFNTKGLHCLSKHDLRCQSISYRMQWFYVERKCRKASICQAHTKFSISMKGGKIAIIATYSNQFPLLFQVVLYFIWYFEATLNSIV